MILGQIITGITVVSVAVFIGVLVYLLCRWILSGEWVGVVIGKICLTVVILIVLFAVFGVAITYPIMILAVAAIIYTFLSVVDVLSII